MGLTDLRSNFDRHEYKDAGPDRDQGPIVGTTVPGGGNYFSQGGASDSPFTSKGNGDHLRALLEDNIVHS